MKLTAQNWTIVGLSAAVLAFVIYAGFQKGQYESRIVTLQNAAAAKDVTIETAQGVYQKLAQQVDGTNGLLDQKDQQLSALQRQLDKAGQQILTATSVTVGLKKPLASSASAKQTVVPSSVPIVGQPPALTEVQRKRVDFTKDFGWLAVTGYALTDPADAFVTVSQQRPLKISLIISEGPDGSWRSSATSSEQDVSVDIGLAAVNKRVIEPRWYEKIGVDAMAAAGATGFLGGLALSYDFTAIDVGPAIYGTIGPSGAVVYYGATVSWHPFRRQ